MDPSDDFFLDSPANHSPDIDEPVDPSTDVERNNAKKPRRRRSTSQDVKWGLADRPNSYTGGRSAYHAWTLEERSVIDALQQQRAEDLSVHLYNAYMVESSKRRTPTAIGAPSTQVVGDSPEGAIKLPGDWTAWPVPSERFIHQDLMSSIGGRTTTDYTKSGRVLRETIVATISRVARHRWQSREWQTIAIPQPRNFKRKRSEPTELRKRESPATSLSEMGQSTSPNTSNAATEAGDVNIGDEMESGGMPLFSSQAQLDEASSSSDHEEAQKPGKRQKHKRLLDEWAGVDTTPVLDADEERIDKLLGLPAQRLISKVDKLLDALHTTRHSYARKAFTKGKAGESEVDPGSSPASTELNDDSLSRDQTRIRFNHKLRPREWSDVLGMAALTGFSEVAVQRASERCAALFNEDMLFRTFHEGTAQNSSCFTETLATGDEPETGLQDLESFASEHSANATGSDSDEYDMYELIRSKTSGHCCPYPQCSRHGKSYRSAADLGKHIRRRHSD